jgi:ribulose-5-phosphate 4-epimerase/fuculose-1-phosphate aldolase
MVQEVIDAHGALASMGHGDLIWGHLGLRDPVGRGVWSKASGWGMEEITADQVVLVSFDGELLVGQGPRHLEVFIHTEIMLRRPEVTATIHTHATAATAFASLDVPLKALSHDATPFMDPDIPRFRSTSNLIRTAALGAELALTIDSSNGCLIPGHGLVAVGTDVSRAVVHAVLLDRACSTQLAAMAAGGPRLWTSAQEVEEKRQTLWPAQAMQAAYRYLVRRSAASDGVATGLIHGSAVCNNDRSLEKERETT